MKQKCFKKITLIILINLKLQLSHQSKLNIPKHNTVLTSFYKKSLLYSAMKLFNYSPTHLKREENVKTFKRNLEQLLYEKAYSTRKFKVIIKMNHNQYLLLTNTVI